MGFLLKRLILHNGKVMNDEKVTMSDRAVIYRSSYIIHRSSLIIPRFIDLSQISFIFVACKW